MTKKNQIQIFNDRQVRTVWDTDSEEWYFSVVDVIGVLTDSKDPATYWKVLKNRLKKEGDETVTNCNRLKLAAADGKMRLTDVATAEQMFRIIQSVPSPKAEPFKMWMAQVAATRLDQMQDSELSIEQAVADYQHSNVARSGGWVAKVARDELESRLGHSIISQAKASDYLLPNDTDHQKEKNAIQGDCPSRGDGA